MSEKLKGFLEDREKRIKEEEQKQLDTVAKAKEAREKREQEFLDTMATVVKPTLEDLKKIFSESGHQLAFQSERITGVPLELKYSLELSGTGIPFILDFNSNVGNVDIAFRLYKQGFPSKAFPKDFTFETITPENLENEIVSALKVLDE